MLPARGATAVPSMAELTHTADWKAGPPTMKSSCVSCAERTWWWLGQHEVLVRAAPGGSTRYWLGQHKVLIGAARGVVGAAQGVDWGCTRCGWGSTSCWLGQNEVLVGAARAVD
eukprot:355910-Chlamydomonas_euryale.AAC.5